MAILRLKFALLSLEPIPHFMQKKNKINKVMLLLTSIAINKQNFQYEMKTNAFIVVSKFLNGVI